MQKTLKSKNMPNPLTHRKATLSDLEAIISLLLEDELGRKRELLDDQALHLYREAFQAIDRDPNHYLMVVEQNTEIVGTCHLTLIPSLAFQGATRMIIEEVRVKASKRSQGIGEWMMKAACVWGQERGAKIMQLTSNKQRKRVHAFYERLGFTASHEGMKLYVDKLAEYRLQDALPDNLQTSLPTIEELEAELSKDLGHEIKQFSGNHG